MAWNLNFPFNTEVTNNDIYFEGNTPDRNGRSNDSVSQVIDWNIQYIIIVRIDDNAK